MVKPEGGSAMYFWLFSTKPVGVNKNLEGLRGTRGGLNPQPPDKLRTAFESYTSYLLNYECPTFLITSKKCTSNIFCSVLLVIIESIGQQFDHMYHDDEYDVSCRIACFMLVTCCRLVTCCTLVTRYMLYTDNTTWAHDISHARHVSPLFCFVIEFTIDFRTIQMKKGGHGKSKSVQAKKSTMENADVESIDDGVLHNDQCDPELNVFKLEFTMVRITCIKFILSLWCN